MKKPKCESVDLCLGMHQLDDLVKTWQLLTWKVLTIIQELPRHCSADDEAMMKMIISLRKTATGILQNQNINIIIHNEIGI